MFPVSGPGFFAPPPRAALGSTQARSNQPPAASAAHIDSPPSWNEELTIDDDPRRASRFILPALIHPGTASCFRNPLETILSQISYRLLQIIVEQGYCLHVVDTQGRQPLTLEAEEVPPEAVEVCQWESPCHPDDIARQRGAESIVEVKDLAQRLVDLNRDKIGDDGLLPGQRDILLPAFRYWWGVPLACGTPHRAWEFLTQPSRSFVAGMVTHGTIEGLRGEHNRIIFWDCAFERGDGLLDWYVLHELGHTTDYALAFRKPEAWREWRSRVEVAYQSASDSGELITRYAGESPQEYLAEGFAAYWREEWSQSSPEFGDLAMRRAALNRAALQALDPMLFDLLEEASELAL